MPSERERLRLEDIIANIDRIDAHLVGVDAANFGQSAIVIDAVERCLQRITEAVIKIGDDRMSVISPSLPVHAIRGLGNILRHEYDLVDDAVIWNTVAERLPTLRVDCLRALAGMASDEAAR